MVRHPFGKIILDKLGTPCYGRLMERKKISYEQSLALERGRAKRRAQQRANRPEREPLSKLEELRLKWRLAHPGEPYPDDLRS